MEIKGISSSVYKNEENLKKISNKSTEPTKKDKIEISEQAKALQGASDSKNLADIKKKIESGFYNRDEVISKVADAILKEITKP